MSNFKYSIAWGGKLYKFSHENKAVLTSEVVNFFNRNNINFNSDDLSKAIDRQSSMIVRPKKIGLADAVTGAKALLRYTQGSAVSSSEITRRSEICKDCPLINRIGGCASCGAAGKIANFVSNIRSSLKLQDPIPDSVKSSYCGVCQCSLALMVPSKMDAFNESIEKNSKRPDNCWLKTTSNNYINE